jgi:hypothetical protein
MRCPPRANNTLNKNTLSKRIVSKRIASTHRMSCPRRHAMQPRAYLAEKAPVTNRIRSHFARIKAVRPYCRFRWLPSQRVGAGGERQRVSRRGFGGVERRPRGRSGHIQEDGQETSERTLRTRPGRKPGRPCRLPCRCRPRRKSAGGAPHPIPGSAKRYDRPAKRSAPHG